MVRTGKIGECPFRVISFGLVFGFFSSSPFRSVFLEIHVVVF